MRAENVFGHAAAKCRAQSFALWPLHQNDQQHQERDQDVNREQEINQDLHSGTGNMAEADLEANAERSTSNTEHRIQTLNFSHWPLSVGRFLDRIPDCIQLRKTYIAQSLATSAHFVLQ